MLFIGTKEKLKEIPFDNEQPDFFIELISDELRPISDKFESKNIYFVGSSRGCSCDLRIREEFEYFGLTEIEIEQKIRQEKSLLNTFRQFFGINNKYLNDKIKRAKIIAKQEQSFFNQTLKLIELLKMNTTELSFTEMYCCWAGEYSEPIEDYKIISISQENQKDYLEIELREKVKFIRQ